MSGAWNNANDVYREVKVCFLGDTAVGKTCIVTHFVQETFGNMEPTVGAAFQSKRVKIQNATYGFQIWDTAGQEKYRSMAPLYYRGSAAAVLVYDITREDSFNCVTYWAEEMRKYTHGDLVVVLVGNKVDREELREVPAAEGERLAAEISAVFMETSAQSGQNIHRIFEEIVKHLPVNAPRIIQTTIKANEKRRFGRKKCC